SAGDLLRLDDTEDPRAYHRSALTVHSLTGQPHPGTHVYFATPDCDDGAPDAQYLDLLITAGRAAGLPPEYLQELTARRATPG
ncbi:MAG TPA: gamma-glutamylcyclotransferase, partial [Kineosporiaceae bacterium]